MAKLDWNRVRRYGVRQQLTVIGGQQPAARIEEQSADVQHQPSAFDVAIGHAAIAYKQKLMAERMQSMPEAMRNPRRSSQPKSNQRPATGYDV